MCCHNSLNEVQKKIKIIAIQQLHIPLYMIVSRSPVRPPGAHAHNTTLFVYYFLFFSKDQTGVYRQEIIRKKINKNPQQYSSAHMRHI